MEKAYTQDIIQTEFTSGINFKKYKKAEEESLNHYFECMIELLVSTCSHNGLESAAGMIARSLANAVPLLNDLE